MTADHTKVKALNAKTAPMSATASSRPPTAGPTKNPMLLIVLETTFAAVSSDGSCARLGKIAAWAGRNTMPAIPVSTDSAYTGNSGPSNSTMAADAKTKTTRTASAPNMTRRRSNRSASVANSGASTAITR